MLSFIFSAVCFFNNYFDRRLTEPDARHSRCLDASELQRIKVLQWCRLVAKFAARMVCDFAEIFIQGRTIDEICRLVRRRHNADVKRIVYLQSCLRRRLARKELKALRAEARSINKFKEISYALENKVVELTQRLQERTHEKKELQVKLAEVEKQLQQWLGRHEETDLRAKHLQSELHESQAQLTKREELLKAKEDIESKLSDALSHLSEKEAQVTKLIEEIRTHTVKLEAQQKTIDAAPRAEDGSIIATLKNENAKLPEPQVF